ncbi:hypothetical protein A2210_02160 [Candidatus Woesebacteria bacterium RIFOXYA1_FULL_40_18]|uniref:Uncharacterized protein n=1 Tax=Candidatus Woesebacteria bacterium RIFOXYA1_FULL_40_18 TaxID=1802532 RepID=A0A1F8CIU4_9BACT|nr:MAG: hypothetical protein A2210_02160 [Candidatus Woesebacteria bacterium RIFOXYA1_FULL_40_18]
MAEHKDYRAWWLERIGIEPKLTEGERTYLLPNTSDVEKLNAQEQIDAIRLIATGDPEAVKIGRQRLRFLLGKLGPED